MRKRVLAAAAVPLVGFAILPVFARSGGAAAVAPPGEVSSGLTELTGHVTFGSGDPSLHLSVAPAGGSLTGTTNHFASGDETIGTLPWTSAVVDYVLETVSATDLGSGTAGQPYYVSVKYDQGGKTYVLSGSIASAPASGSASIKLE